MKPATYFQAISAPRWYLQPGLFGAYPHLWVGRGLSVAVELAWADLDAGYSI